MYVPLFVNQKYQIKLLNYLTEIYNAHYIIHCNYDLRMQFCVRVSVVKSCCIIIVRATVVYM